MSSKGCDSAICIQEDNSHKKGLAEAVVIDVNKPDDLLLREDNHRVVDESRYGRMSSESESESNDYDADNEALIDFPSEDFSDLWHQIVENDLLPARQRKAVLVNCMEFLLAAVQNVIDRFPESAFICQSCTFLDPRRLRQTGSNIASVIDRFNNDFFDSGLICQQYTRFRNDDDLGFIFEENDNDITSFWCDIYCNFSEYKELSKLSILILTLSPNTCDCERGFSTLNYVKNEYRSKLTNQNLNACMAVGLEERSVSSFPFEKFV